MKQSTRTGAKTILLSGGGGFLGVILCEQLLNSGFKVRILDKFYFGIDPLKHLSNKLEIIQADLRQPPLDIFNNIEVIIHLAGLSNDPTAEFNPKLNLEINTAASINFAKMAKKAGVSRFIFASSCSIYDAGIQASSFLSDENSSVDPKAAYSLSKYLAEKQLLKLKSENFCVVILRKGTIIGFSPRMRYDLVVNTMVKDAISTGIIKLFCQGIQWRPVIDVKDASDAYLKVMLAPKKIVNGQIFNIALDNFMVKNLAFLVQKVLKDKYKVKSNLKYLSINKKDRSYKVSTAKAKKVLNFRPKYQVEMSIHNLMSYISKGKFNDFKNPLYYNIDWMKPILEKEQI